MNIGEGFNYFKQGKYHLLMVDRSFDIPQLLNLEPFPDMLEVKSITVSLSMGIISMSKYTIFIYI